MKKLLAMLIALTCAFFTFSCNEDGGKTLPPIPVSDNGVSFSEFVSAVDAMGAVKSATIETTVKNELKGELVSALDITYAADGSSVIEYSIDRYNDDLSSGGGFIITDTGAVSCDKNGAYSAPDFVGSVIANGAYALNLDQYKLNNARIEGSILYAEIFSMDTLAVLGVKIDATVSVAIVIADGNIVALSADYVKSGNQVSVRCSYGF